MSAEPSTAKISLSLSHGRKPAPAPANGVKRSRATALQDDEEDAEQYGRAQKVSHFDRKIGGAFDEDNKEDDSPLVIPRQSNRDWKAAANSRRRQRSGLPTDNSATQSTQVVAPAESATRFGLNVFNNDGEANAQGVLADEEDVAHATEQAAETQVAATDPVGDAPLRERTDDEIALDALLGRTVEDRGLVLPQQADPVVTETDAFRNDFSSAPPMASLDDYARVPVEHFGAALLRGMGWKDGEGIGTQRGKKLAKVSTKPPERRAALLGIGAKEDAAITQEIGAWGKAAKGGKGEIKIYNPVLLKDKKTGELFTEDELQRKQEKETREKFEQEFDAKEKERKKRRDGDADREHSRSHRERDWARGDDRDRRKDDSHRRDRDRDYDRARDSARDRDSRKHDDSDEEYYRRKEKERRRRHERDYDEKDGRGHDREKPRRREGYDDRASDRHGDGHSRSSQSRRH